MERNYFSRLGIATSMWLNALTGGHHHMTFSARQHHWRRKGKPNLATLVDFIFIAVAWALNKFTHPRTPYDFSNHCMESWVAWRTRKDVIDSLNKH